VATGRCLFCDELVPDDHRWCQDSNCMDLWERERRMKYERV
jgi:predicted nucleic acid-binding Zn ribbon protein